MIVIDSFPRELVWRAWEWMQEYPNANFDDYGPCTFSDFALQFDQRVERGEHMWLVKKDDQPCGIVCYVPATPRMGSFHGICFAKGHCNKTEKRAAVTFILGELFLSGVEKVCAGYFADNVKIGRLLADVGAVQEGLLARHTVRNGKPLDMVQVAIFSSRV